MAEDWGLPENLESEHERGLHLSTLSQQSPFTKGAKMLGLTLLCSSHCNWYILDNDHWVDPDDKWVVVSQCHPMAIS